MSEGLAVCIGCGCDDLHACPEGCAWLRVDYKQGQGVCSECPGHVAGWDLDRNKNKATWQNQLGGRIEHKN